MGEFPTSGVASIAQQSLPFPVYFPLVAASTTSRGRHYHRLEPTVWPEIRRRARIEGLRHLAAAYGVSHETIRRIIQTVIASEESTL